ncbi:MAG: RcnB family protein [Polaromonas sp.]|nr:RcnB family protein [Polaromonas sp.]
MLSALLLCGAALAQRSDRDGGGRHGNDGDNRDSRGKGGQHSQSSDRHGPEMHGTDRRGSDRQGQGRRDDDRQGPSRAEVRAGAYFQDRQRSAVHDYYGTQYRAGRCPPGLSKKHNGCMPPGQVRYYSVGQRLAPAVIYHTVPSAMVVTLGVPPAGHRYVRVASDILLIAVGTGMVVDAIQDLGGM